MNDSLDILKKTLSDYAGQNVEVLNVEGSDKEVIIQIRAHLGPNSKELFIRTPDQRVFDFLKNTSDPQKLKEWFDGIKGSFEQHVRHPNLENVVFGDGEINIKFEGESKVHKVSLTGVQKVIAEGLADDKIIEAKSEQIQGKIERREHRSPAHLLKTGQKIKKEVSTLNDDLKQLKLDQTIAKIGVAIAREGHLFEKTAPTLEEIRAELSVNDYLLEAPAEELKDFSIGHLSNEEQKEVPFSNFLFNADKMRAMDWSEFPADKIPLEAFVHRKGTPSQAELSARFAVLIDLIDVENMNPHQRMEIFKFLPLDTLPKETVLKLYDSFPSEISKAKGFEKWAYHNMDESMLLELPPKIASQVAIQAIHELDENKVLLMVHHRGLIENEAVKKALVRSPLRREMEFRLKEINFLLGKGKHFSLKDGQLHITQKRTTDEAKRYILDHLNASGFSEKADLLIEKIVEHPIFQKEVDPEKTLKSKMDLAKRDYAKMQIGALDLPTWDASVEVFNQLFTPEDTIALEKKPAPKFAALPLYILQGGFIPGVNELNKPPGDVLEQLLIGALADYTPTNSVQEEISQSEGDVFKEDFRVRGMLLTMIIGLEKKEDLSLLEVQNAMMAAKVLVSSKMIFKNDPLLARLAVASDKFVEGREIDFSETPWLELNSMEKMKSMIDQLSITEPLVETDPKLDGAMKYLKDHRSNYLKDPEILIDSLGAIFRFLESQKTSTGYFEYVAEKSESHAKAAAQMSTWLTNRISEEIIGLGGPEITLEESTKRIVGYMDLVDRLMELGNFQAAVAIYSSFASSPVERIIKGIGLSERLNSLTTILGREGNFKVQRSQYEAFIKEGKELLKFSGLLTTDLTFAKDANDPNKIITENVADMKRADRFYKIFKPYNMQRPELASQDNPEMVLFLRGIKEIVNEDTAKENPLDGYSKFEDALFKRSKKILPSS